MRYHLIKQHWRQAETWLLLCALTLAIFATYGLTAAGVLLQESVQASRAELMGADRVLQATRPAQPRWLQQATKLQLRLSEQRVFNSMLFASDEVNAAMALISVKAVAPNYPIKGALVVTGGGQVWHQPPLKGEIYLDLPLKSQLQLQLGDSIALGEAQFKVAGWLESLPDVGVNVLMSRPTVLMRLDEVAQTQLLQAGSRRWFRYLWTGTATQLEQYDAWLSPQLSPIYRYQGGGDRDFALASALAQSDKVLRLAGLLIMLLSLAAMAVIADRFASRQRREVALLKALGLSRSAIRRSYIGLLLMVAGLAMVSGLAAAYLALAWGEAQLLAALPQLLNHWVPAACLLSVGSSVGGCLLFSGLALEPLLATSVAALMAQQPMSTPLQSRYRLGVIVLFVCLLLLLFARSWSLALLLLLTGALALLLVSGVSRALLLFGQRLLLGQQFTGSRSLIFRLVLRNLSAKLAQNRLLLLGFTLASLMVLTLTYLKQDLLTQWQQQLPQGAANYFALNIQPKQQQPLRTWLQQRQLSVSHFYPIVRGRLAQRNGQQLSERVDEQAQRYLTRELNLTSRPELPEGDELIAGSYLTGTAELSLASTMAEQLQVQLGDVLTFDIAGQTLQGRVGSIRQVNWSNMRPNFYVVASADLLAPFSASYLASFYLPVKSQLNVELARDFPTISLIDVRSLLGRLERLLQQLTLALTLIVMLTTGAAGLLLIAQCRASLDSKVYELVTLQTLGASRRVLVSVTLLEFALLGLIAGLIAAFIGELLLAGLFYGVLAMAGQWHPSLWLLGPAFAMGTTSLLGWLGCRHLLREGALRRLKAGYSGG